MTRLDSKEHAAATDPVLRALRGMVRRVTVSLTGSTLWRVLGHTITAGGKRESPDVEPFTGIGFYSRPPATGNPEAVMLSVGGADHPVLVGLRDEKTRAAVAAALGIDPDETAVFNSLCALYLKSDGVVEVRTLGGVAVALSLKSDTDNLRAYVRAQFSALTGHVHTVVGGSTTTQVAASVPQASPPSQEPAAVVGTTNFKTH